MRAIENAEVRAWLDMYAAIPPHHAQRYNPEIMQVDGVTLTRCREIPFSHFNSVLDLGGATPATESQVDAILACYREAGIPRFTVIHNPHAQPPQLLEWLEARGLRPRGGWERVYRAGGHFTTPEPAVNGSVEPVSREIGSEWASFLVNSYGLPTGPWLEQLVERPGWHHAVLRREGRIVAARSLFVSAGGWAWLGVEAPVPGIMAPSYADDFALTHALVVDGLRRGVTHFAADIEAPSAARHAGVRELEGARVRVAVRADAVRERVTASAAGRAALPRMEAHR
ncbi:MAG TPA: hypothetical protein VFJ82_08315 [Longimicrobium sp.]|nr:hypothetical protein [Longimicrobium sp.]